MGEPARDGTRRIVIELDPASEPIVGRLSRPDGQLRPFRGWLELTSLIEAARVGGVDDSSSPDLHRKG